ncbi:hypothetical protein KIN20_003232 [Parelaphostrongylus tenuis]|uniref:Uncharacterized protein n=1 Tax=Parelaphostrongylus tenuis TaxID=148309 RepID=A0AAD5MFB5_PARTN|nr:hypothetical protein KIN20_003232 [Parelaphostrongylus tenuis]
MAVFPTSPLMILILTFATVLGCGVMPPGQASTRNFTVTGFTLPVSMVYSANPAVRAKAFGIAESSDAVQAFVSRLVMQTVLDVLDQQGHSALLPDAIISTILSQLTIQVRYEPLECKGVEKDPTAMFNAGMMKLPHCIIFGSAVTALCTETANNGCDISMNKGIQTIPAKHFSILGSLATTNIVMASWSRQMWQSVMSRAIRMLASGPSGSHFFSAFATVS